ncbi:hypothetical protein ACT00Z_10290 [Bacillus stercoris]|uniref:hypothetical protein n=1 Tax=Bacillus stercoris TaxID=2054641 RepID=UPI0010AA622A|nr:hypothetical protein C6Y43_06020 [Bacillus subtilis]
MLMYIGNGHYCYSNSTAMFLSSIGENVSPQLVEILTGVGLGAMIENEKNLYFSMRDPDDGINYALNILGFTAEEHQQASDLDDPFPLLKQQIKQNPVILGPLDMGELTYHPNHKNLNGSDHYVLGYQMDNENIYVQDPAGFPFVPLSLDQFKKAWMAERIPYRKGINKYWSTAKKVVTLDNNEIYERAIDYFKRTYREFEKVDMGLIGREAICFYADQLLNASITADTIGHTTFFLFQLSARRANDYAVFFKDRHSHLSVLKTEQAKVFGMCHSMSVNKDWKGISEKLMKLADLEDNFRLEILKVGY